jgi:hypothetical protein
MSRFIGSFDFRNKTKAPAAKTPPGTLPFALIPNRLPIDSPPRLSHRAATSCSDLGSAHINPGLGAVMAMMVAAVVVAMVARGSERRRGNHQDEQGCR